MFHESPFSSRWAFTKKEIILTPENRETKNYCKNPTLCAISKQYTTPHTSAFIDGACILLNSFKASVLVTCWYLSRCYTHKYNVTCKNVKIYKWYFYLIIMPLYCLLQWVFPNGNAIKNLNLNVNPQILFGLSGVRYKLLSNDIKRFGYQGVPQGSHIGPSWHVS